MPSMTLALSLRSNLYGTTFSPAGLFAYSEPGVWYDPSDLTTLFQDASGTTPVTAAGQPVGLMLDKSKGLVLGPELISNGTFDSGTTGWTSGTTYSGTLSAPSSVLTITTSSGNGFGSAIQSVPLTLGKTYRLTGTRRSSSGGNPAIGFGNSTGAIQSVLIAGSTSTTTNEFTASFVYTGNLLTLFNQTVTNGAVSEFDNISVRELPGNHATQSTAASRPTYQIDGTGRGYLNFDGVDDFLVTNTITPGIDKAQVFAGVRKLSDAGSVIAEISLNVSLNAGTFILSSGSDLGVLGNQSGYASLARGSAAATALLSTQTVVLAPDIAVLTVTHDIAGDLSTIRRNTVDGASATGDKGTGNFLAYPLYIGRRAGTSVPFNGNIYSLITRFGSNLSAEQITATETWVNTKTGAY